MGMSAGQARLLSITTRLNNNEFSAQTITNSKLRLAEKSSEASQDYIDALNSQKLMYGIYNDNGDRSYTNLTAGTLLTFGDLRNQYSMVNSAGQVLMSGSDIKKYEESETLTEFLDKYGINKVENPKYSEALDEIFGKNYENYYGNGQTYSTDWLTGYINNNTNTIFTVNIDKLTKDDYKQLAAGFKNAHNVDYTGNEEGFYGNYAYLLNALPSYADYATKPNLMDYANDLLKPACWTETGITNGGTPSTENIAHMEHVLSQYLWNGINTSLKVNINGREETISKKVGDNGETSWGLSRGGGDGSDPMNVRGVLNKFENSELKKELQELYYQICLYIKKDNTVIYWDGGNSELTPGLYYGEITNEGSNNVMLEEDIGKKYKELIKKLLEAVAKDLAQAPDNDYRLNSSTKIQEYRRKSKKYNEFVSQFNFVKDNIDAVVNEFKRLIDSVPLAEIPDSTDSKYQWYVNLWYRMGGINETTKGDPKYKELDENLMNNTEWLEFALEHGVITLEQAQFAENGSKEYPNMGTFDWVSTIYTNSPDIVSQDDEVAIAIAEAKYKKTMNEIESQDKKYDQDLKNLETEHNALQTEYESFKGTVDKNVERSFKAFS